MNPRPKILLPSDFFTSNEHQNPVDHTIVCTTSPGKLSDLADTPYRALSYAWKDKVYLTDPDDHTPGDGRIVCNCQKTWILATLYLALRRIRQRLPDPCMHLGRFIISNQADYDEKTSQVALMDDIYAMADEVIIWLGEGSPNIAHIQFEWAGDGRDNPLPKEYVGSFNQWEYSSTSNDVYRLARESIRANTSYFCTINNPTVDLNAASNLHVVK